MRLQLFYFAKFGCRYRPESDVMQRKLMRVTAYVYLVNLIKNVLCQCI
jgi:hypothetical protein